MRAACTAEGAISLIDSMTQLAVRSLIDCKIASRLTKLMNQLQSASMQDVERNHSYNSRHYDVLTMNLSPIIHLHK